MMCELISKRLLHDGMMSLMFRHDEMSAPKLERHLPHFVLRKFSGYVQVKQIHDGEILRTDVLYPYLGMCQVRLEGGWREFIVIHRIYGKGLSDCVRLGVEAWGKAKNAGVEIRAFVKVLPKGVESGVEVNGIHLFQAEWMMRDAVAVG